MPNVKEDALEPVQGNPANDYSPGMLSGSWAVGQSMFVWFPIWDMRLACLLPLFKVFTSCLAPNFLSFSFFSFFELKKKKCGYRQIKFREVLFNLHPTYSIPTLLKPMFSSKIFWRFLSPPPANFYRVLKINLLKILKAIVFSDLCWPLIWALSLFKAVFKITCLNSSSGN